MNGHNELDPIQAAIHAAICEDSPEECLDGEGLCVQAAEAAVDGVQDWRIAEHASNGEDVALLHTCSDEGAGDVAGYVNEEFLGDLLHTIATHDCEEER
jgi:hypothetical protein